MSDAGRRYTVTLEPPAERQLEKLPRQAQARVARAIDALARDPRPPGVVKLSGGESLYRVRAGDYRVVYAIEDRELCVMVVRVGDRKDIYR